MFYCCFIYNFNDNIRKSDLKLKQTASCRSSQIKIAESKDNEVEKEDSVKPTVKKQRYNKKKDIAA